MGAASSHGDSLPAPTSLTADATAPSSTGAWSGVQQTILDECWKPAFARYLIPKQPGLRLDLERYLRYSNTQRAPYRPLDQRPHPQAILGKAKLWQKKR